MRNHRGGAAANAVFNEGGGFLPSRAHTSLPLEVTYTYLQDAEDYGDVLRYNYQKKTLTLPLTVRVTPDLQVEVLMSAPSR